MHAISVLLISLVFQSINALINPSISSSINPSTNPSINPSIVRPSYQFSLPLEIDSHTDTPFQVQLVKPSIKQRIDQSINDQSTKQSRFALSQYEEAVAILSGCSNVAFSAPVYVNGQGPFKLIVDTGSTTMSVVSTTCTNCYDVAPAFNTSGMSTVIDNGDVSVAYADGSSWSGAGWRGDVSVGDPLLGGSLPISMIFATIESHNKFVNVSQCGVYQTRKNWHQGIIGFAYPGLGSKGTDEWFANYVQQTGIANEFTMQMCVTPSGSSSGNLWIGAYDKTYVAGQFIYVPIVKENHYNTYLNKIYITSQYQSTQSTNLGFGTKDYGSCQDGINFDCAIVDSGTTYMSFPTPVRDRMIATIQADPGYKRYISDTDYDPLAQRGCYRDNLFEPFDVLNANLPTISFVFAQNSKGLGSVTVTLRPMNGYLVISYDASGNKYYCIGIGSTGESATILGYSFMNQFTVRHDIENRRMGFAPTRQCGVAAPIMPNLQWNVSDWSSCDASCGGWQWRRITCTDIYGGTRSDLACYDGFAGPKPEIGRPCAQTTCQIVNSTRVTGVSINPSITQLSAGTSVDVLYTFAGTPSVVQLYLQPINSVNKWPHIITKNASFAANVQSGTHRWTVPTSLPAGQYVFGGFTQFGRNEFIASPTNLITILPTSLSQRPSIDATVKPCGVDGASGSPVCSNHGRCSVSAQNEPICSCITGYTGPSCNVSTISTCAIQCSNEGVADSSDCTCKCPNQFSGVLCEYRYVTMTAVLTMDPLKVDGLSPGANHDMFKRGFIADIAFASGVPSDDVNILSVFPSGSTGLRTAVTFTVAIPSDTTALRTLAAFLRSLVVYPSSSQSYTSVSAGLFSQYITVTSAVGFPPNSFKLSDHTGDDIIVTLSNHLTLIIGVACGVMGGLLMMCVGCLCFQRRELKNALSSSAFRRRDSVVKRVEALNGVPVEAAPRIRVQS